MLLAWFSSFTRHGAVSGNPSTPQSRADERRANPERGLDAANNNTRRRRLLQVVVCGHLLSGHQVCGRMQLSGSA